MKSLPLLLFALALVACGESTPATSTSDGAGSSGGLTARAEPLAVGDVAPAFPGLPSGGKTVVVFYRGPW